MNYNKLLLAISLFLLSVISHSQEKTSTWVSMENEPTTTLSFTKSETQSVNDISLKAIWDDKLSYSANIGYYGGISELHIFKNKKQIQTIKKIEDGIALGYIHITFYDYNMDGYLDFTIPIDCGKSCYDYYYIFNPKTNKFEHSKSWDYVRIDKLNKSKKQILSIPDGNAGDTSHYLYKVDGKQLIKVKSIKN